MSHVVVIGCGVVGAAIAYELSKSAVQVTVIDKQSPAQGATGAALGVLMGIISHKTKGNAWRMRQTSIQRYETLIPELELLTGVQIPFNRQGILLCCEGELALWEQLVAIRRTQGWHLEIWHSAQIAALCPQANCDTAIYSPQDRQVNPVALTKSLVQAAQYYGATFHFGVTVKQYLLTSTSNQLCCKAIRTQNVAGTDHPVEVQDIDWLVLAAGLGSSQCLPPQSSLDFQLNIQPVLGQALQVQLSHPLGNANFQPVITGDDVHIVPCTTNAQAGTYWIGATVEFPQHQDEILPEPANLEAVMAKAIALCPSLAAAKITKTWSGLRPRPVGRPAPIIGHLPGYNNVLVATGHYRNGVLLAPATAEAVRQLINS